MHTIQFTLCAIQSCGFWQMHTALYPLSKLWDKTILSPQLISLCCLFGVITYILWSPQKTLMWSLFLQFCFCPPEHHNSGIIQLVVFVPKCIWDVPVLLHIRRAHSFFYCWVIFHFMDIAHFVCLFSWRTFALFPHFGDYE